MSDDDDSISFENWLNVALEHQMMEIHTSIPAVVLSYDATKQKVSVQPLIKHGYRNEVNDRIADKLPVIVDVPVEFPGSGPFSITWPIAKGHTGLLAFCESSIDLWKSRGGIVDPIDDRRFNLSDAVFRPGLRPYSSPIPSSGVDGSHMMLNAPNEIHVGGGDTLALLSDVQSLKTALQGLSSSGAPLSGVATAAGGAVLVGTAKLKGG